VNVVLLDREDAGSEQLNDNTDDDAMDEDEDLQQKHVQANQPQNIHMHLHLPAGWNNTQFSFNM
jgi:hypothetical protein